MNRLEERVNTHYNQLSENDRMILQYILNHRKESAFLSIQEMADQCNISRGSISRFAQKLGFEGYGELKLYLKWEIEGHQSNYVLAPEKIISAYRQNIDALEKYDFTNICRMVYEAKRIFAYATGTVQLSVANDLKRLFSLKGKFITTLYGGAETESVVSSSVEEGDLFFLISLSGENEAQLRHAEILHAKKIPLISMTQMSNNTLAKMCEENIYIYTDVCAISGEVHLWSTNSFFLVSEILAFHYYQYLEKQL